MDYAGSEALPPTPFSGEERGTFKNDANEDPTQFFAFRREMLSHDDPFSLSREFRPEIGEAVSHIPL